MSKYLDIRAQLFYFKTIMPFCRVLVYSLLLILAMGWRGHAEQFNPATVMISRFTFTRPEPWVWVSSDKRRPEVHVEVIFRVNDESTRDGAKVSINHFEKDEPTATPAATAQRWMTWFQSTTEVVPLSAPVQIGSNKVSYTSMTGRFRGAHPNAPIRPNYALFGAIIEDAEGNLVIRLAGPPDEVAKSSADVKKMIEKALKE